jgi:hypothetical protein
MQAEMLERRDTSVIPERNASPKFGDRQGFKRARNH